MKKIINWKIFTVLLSLNIFSVFAVFPYVLTVQGDLLSQANIPIATLFVAQLVQTSILFSVAIISGLVLSQRINFHLPLLEAIVAKKDYQKILKEISPVSISLGILIALAIYFTDYLFTYLGAALSTSQDLAPAWQKLLASFYGGITEETLMRLFLMSFLVWLGMKLTRRNQPTSFGIIVSILIASIIFGLGHLPITASLTTITPLIIIRAIVLNSIGGIVFGYLFWKKGLESAIIAHFTTDVFLLTILPIIF